MSESRPPQALAKALHVCPECGSPLVQPIHWEQAEGTSWKLWRRCPECEWRGRSVHSAAEVDDFDEQLDLGSHELVHQLRAFEHANMSELTETFVAALSADLIGADDFSR